MTEWRTIDSAPRDGTFIALGYLDKNGTMGVRGAEWGMRPKWAVDGAWVDPLAKGLVDHRATHWMPLPAPPTKERA